MDTAAISEEKGRAVLCGLGLRRGAILEREDRARGQALLVWFGSPRNVLRPFLRAPPAFPERPAFPDLMWVAVTHNVTLARRKGSSQVLTP